LNVILLNKSEITFNINIIYYQLIITYRQGKFIYIANFIHNGNSKCFT